MRYAAICAVGLEKVVLSEIKGCGIEISKIEILPGIIFFDCEEDNKKLSALKTVDDILFFIKKFSGISRYKSSLKNFMHQAAKANFRALAGEKKDISFIVKASYDQRIDYTAKEVENAVILGIKKHYGWKLDKKNHDLYINVIITKDLSFCAVSIENVPLHVKNKLQFTVPGSLRNSVACSLLRIAGIKENDIILDPMCGSGVIAIEASLSGCKAIAGDIEKESIELAKKNCAHKHANVSFHVWDACDTILPKGTIDKVISNLPFDKQVSLNQDISLFFSKFLDEMIRVSKGNSRFVFLTMHSEILKKIAEEKKLKVLENIKIKNAGLESEIVMIEKK